RVPVATALVRLGRNASERFERAEFLFRVDAEYERLGLVPIDATGSPEAVGPSVRARGDAVLRGLPGPGSSAGWRGSCASGWLRARTSGTGRSGSPTRCSTWSCS